MRIAPYKIIDLEKIAQRVLWEERMATIFCVVLLILLLLTVCSAFKSSKIK